MAKIGPGPTSLWPGRQQSFPQLEAYFPCVWIPSSRFGRKGEGSLIWALGYRDKRRSCQVLSLTQKRSRTCWVYGSFYTLRPNLRHSPASRAPLHILILPPSLFCSTLHPRNSLFYALNTLRSFPPQGLCTCQTLHGTFFLCTDRPSSFRLQCKLLLP